MESYPVDIDAAQVVRWIKAEYERSPSTFRISARRSREIREIPLRPELHLGDGEREDLTEIATIGMLEIGPAHAADGWLLRVIVEDEIGPGVSDGDMASADEQQIDLGAFYHEFIRPGRGNANITAEAEDAAARARLDRLLQAIVTNERHPQQAQYTHARHPEQPFDLRGEPEPRTSNRKRPVDRHQRLDRKR